jgi:hypothetical protein
MGLPPIGGECVCEQILEVNYPHRRTRFRPGRANPHRGRIRSRPLARSTRGTASPGPTPELSEVDPGRLQPCGSPRARRRSLVKRD